MPLSPISSAIPPRKECVFPGNLPFNKRQDFTAVSKTNFHAVSNVSGGRKNLHSVEEMEL